MNVSLPNVATCMYALNCCPGVDTCLDNTNATCLDGEWDVSVSVVNCSDAPSSQPPPAPPPTENSTVVWIAALGGLVCGVLVLGAVLCVRLSHGRRLKTQLPAQASNALLASTSRPVGSTAPASVPYWTFRSLVSK